MAEQFAAGFPDDEFTVTGDPGQIAAVTASLRAIGQHCVECAAELRRVRPDWVAVEEVKWSVLRDSRYEEILRAGRAYAQAAGAFGPFGTQLADLQRRMALVRQDAEAAYARLQSARQTLVSDGAKAAVELVTKGPAALGSATQQAVGRDKATVDAVQGEYEALRSQAQALRSEAQSDAARCAAQLNQIDRPGGTPAERAAAFQAEQAAKAEAANKSGWQSFVDFVGDAFAKSGEAQAAQAEAELEADREMAKQVGNGISWAAHGFVDHVEAAWDAHDAFSGAFEDAVDLIGRGSMAMGTGDEPMPEPSEFLAATGMLLGTAAGVVANGVSGKRLRLFDNGKPWTGTPTRDKGYAAPMNFTSFTEAAAHAYWDASDNPATEHGEARVIAIHKSGEPTRYIIAIPGTQAPIGDTRGWEHASNGRSWPANLQAVGAGHTAYSDAVMAAVDKAVALDQAEHSPSGTGRPQVMVTGHSQGGILAQDIAADPRFQQKYDVRGIVTYGSPNLGQRIGDTPLLSVQHGDGDAGIYHRGTQAAIDQGGDIVPWTDLNLKTTPQTTQVNLPAPHPFIHVPAHDFDIPHGPRVTVPSGLPSFSADVMGDHDQNEYVQSVSQLNAENQSQVRGYEQRTHLSDFYARSANEATVYVAPAGTR